MKRCPTTDRLFTGGTLHRAAGNTAHHRLLADEAQIAGHGCVRGQLHPEPVSFLFLLPS